MKTAKDAFLYRKTMRESRKIFRNIGLPQFLFMVLFGAASTYVFLPLMGKLWEFTLMTTPDGFISNANLLQSLAKAPWIVLIFIVLVVLYALLAMWQTTAIIIGIDYARKNQKIRFFELILISFRYFIGQLKARNWMILLYSLLIVPLADIYRTSDFINGMIVPEYIQDFINVKPILFVLCVIAFLLIVYVALRWMFVYPSFVLKKNSFGKACKESHTITSKSWLKNGINLGIYSLIEYIRLSILPLLMIILPVVICYFLTKEMSFANGLFRSLGLTWGIEIVQTVTAVVAQMSIMCFMVELYHVKLDGHQIGEELALPTLKGTYEKKFTVGKFLTVLHILDAVILSSVYLATVFYAQNNSDTILELFGTTEIVAHKGYSSMAPENTMPAFELADTCGKVDYIELDVWSSKDGIPVVIHNSTITDATGIDRYIYDCTYEELKEIPAPYYMDEADYPDARIPSLEEVIEKYADSTPLLIEIKGYKQDNTLPEKIVALMKKYGCTSTSMIHSGDYNAIKAVKKIDSDIQCGLIMAIVTGNYYDLPYTDFFSIEHTFVNQEIVSVLHRHGKKVYAWTVNYDESVEALQFTDVDGLITDYPEDIEKYVSDTNGLFEDAITQKFARYFDRERSRIGQAAYENSDY